MSELKAFEDVVIFSESGVSHNALVVTVKANGLVDLVFCKPVLSGDGKTPISVIGSSRQGELVQFRHDVPPSQYEVVEDWFFGLNDEELKGLLSERDRRIHEKQQADQAKQSQEEENALLGGVVIKPSQAVLDQAGELWKQAVRKSQQLDDHTEIALPDYGKSPEKWEPWIERAKSQLSVPVAGAEKAVDQPAGKGDKGPEDPQGGLVN